MAAARALYALGGTNARAVAAVCGPRCAATALYPVTFDTTYTARIKVRGLYAAEGRKVHRNDKPCCPHNTCPARWLYSATMSWKLPELAGVIERYGSTAAQELNRGRFKEHSGEQRACTAWGLPLQCRFLRVFGRCCLKFVLCSAIATTDEYDQSTTVHSEVFTFTHLRPLNEAPLGGR